MPRDWDCLSAGRGSPPRPSAVPGHRIAVSWWLGCGHRLLERASGRSRLPPRVPARDRRVWGAPRRGGGVGLAVEKGAGSRAASGGEGSGTILVPGENPSAVLRGEEIFLFLFLFLFLQFLGVGNSRELPGAGDERPWWVFLSSGEPWPSPSSLCLTTPRFCRISLFYFVKNVNFFLNSCSMLWSRLQPEPLPHSGRGPHLAAMRSPPLRRPAPPAAPGGSVPCRSSPGAARPGPGRGHMAAGGR